MVLLVEVHCCKFQYFQCLGCLGDPSVVFVFISYLYTKIVAYGIQRRRIINQFFFALREVNNCLLILFVLPL